MAENVKTGDRVRDPLSELEGIVVARTDWMYGCVRVSIQPAEIKDGKPVDWVNLDEPQCEAVPKAKTAKRPDGAKPAGPRPADPGRPTVQCS